MTSLTEVDAECDSAIDMAEVLVESWGWEFSRLSEAQLSIGKQGTWTQYSLTLAENPDGLRIICSFPLQVPDKRLPVLYELLNLINDTLWEGHFTWSPYVGGVVYRGMRRSHIDDVVFAAEVSQMITNALDLCELYFPAFSVASEQKGKNAIFAFNLTAFVGLYGRA